MTAWVSYYDMQAIIWSNDVSKVNNIFLVGGSFVDRNLMVLYLFRM
jgi:hypothetical protein